MKDRTSAANWVTVRFLATYGNYTRGERRPYPLEDPGWQQMVDAIADFTARNAG